MHSQPREGSLPDSYKNVWMLFLNGPESLVFCDENYTTAELLDKADARLFRLVQACTRTLSSSSFT